MQEGRTACKKTTVEGNDIVLTLSASPCNGYHNYTNEYIIAKDTPRFALCLYNSLHVSIPLYVLMI